MAALVAVAVTGAVTAASVPLESEFAAPPAGSFEASRHAETLVEGAPPVAAAGSVNPSLKHLYRSQPAPGERAIEVKFTSAVTSQSLSHMDALRQLNDPTRRSGDAGEVVETVRPMFNLADPALRELATNSSGPEARAGEATGVAGAELAKWAVLRVAPGQDAQAIAAELNARADVEVAYVRSRPVTPPRTVNADLLRTQRAADNFQPRQLYLQGPEQYGVNALWAHGVPGGRGGNVAVADVEVGWQLDHPDLPTLTPASVLTQEEPDSGGEFHGTAVMGEMVAADNGFGVTGIVPDAKPYVAHVITKPSGFEPARAIATAAAKLTPGDVLVVELQTYGCKGDGGKGNMVAQEWHPASYDAIKAATAKGVHVVAASGNGAEDLDAGCYGRPFPGGKPDSGAIMVGAGAGKASDSQRQCGQAGRRQPFSTYGSRVNANAWGLCVVTTTVNGGYTMGFSGTSSATPIVAGAVASISSIAKQRGIKLTPAQMRDLIVRTGTVNAPRELVGTLPDIKRAVAELEGGAPNPVPTTTAPGPVKPTATATPTVTKPQPTVTTTAAPTTTVPTTPAPTSSSPVDASRCDADQTFTYTGSVTAGGTAIVPNGRFYQARPGRHSFCVESPAASKLTVTLQVWDGQWRDVAAGKPANSVVKLAYQGQTGFYRLIVGSPDAANFTLKYVVPTGRR